MKLLGWLIVAINCTLAVERVVRLFLASSGTHPSCRAGEFFDWKMDSSIGQGRTASQTYKNCQLISAHFFDISCAIRKNYFPYTSCVSRSSRRLYSNNLSLEFILMMENVETEFRDARKFNRLLLNPIFLVLISFHF